MVEWITGTIRALSYPGVVLLMFLENLFPPIPSEVIMPLAAYTLIRGKTAFLGVVAAGTLGAVLGALPLYYIGKRMGEERVKEWADRHGKWLTVSGKDIERAREWFDRHGAAAVFFGRLVPGLRSVISLPAGIDCMPLPSFLIYSTLGAGVWCALLTAAGYVLSENYQLVEKYLSPATWIVLGLVVVGYLYRLFRHGREEPGDGVKPPMNAGGRQ